MLGKTFIILNVGIVFIHDDRHAGRSDFIGYAGNHTVVEVLFQIVDAGGLNQAEVQQSLGVIGNDV